MMNLMATSNQQPRLLAYLRKYAIKIIKKAIKIKRVRTEKQFLIGMQLHMMSLRTIRSISFPFV